MIKKMMLTLFALSMVTTGFSFQECPEGASASSAAASSGCGCGGGSTGATGG